MCPLITCNCESIAFCDVKYTGYQGSVIVAVSIEETWSSSETNSKTNNYHAQTILKNSIKLLSQRNWHMVSSSAPIFTLRLLFWDYCDFSGKYLFKTWADLHSCLPPKQCKYDKPVCSRFAHWFWLSSRLLESRLIISFFSILLSSRVLSSCFTCSFRWQQSSDW